MVHRMLFFTTQDRLTMTKQIMSHTYHGQWNRCPPHLIVPTKSVDAGVPSEVGQDG